MAQYNANTSLFLGQAKTLFEVNMLATESGDLVTGTNRLPVDIGNTTINISGNVNVVSPEVVTVNSSPLDPVHVHITEIGNTDLTNFTYMPISGNVVVTSGNIAITSGNVAVTGFVNVGNFPPSQNVVITSGNVAVTGSVNVGNIPASQNVVVTSGNIAVTGSVNVGNFPPSQNVVVTSGNIDADIAFAVTQTDAFGRLRTSSPLTLFDSSHRYRDNNLWSTSNTAGTTYAHSVNEGLVALNLPTTANAEIIRESTKVCSYQPGKSLFILNTFVPATPKANLRQRVGYFGAQNGIYYELDGNTAYFVERSYSTGALIETRKSQAEWSENTLPSLDKTKAQIFWMDVEWLGLGTVRCGFVIDGQLIHCHSFHHANLIESTYITTASLPLRYEIKNTGTTASPSTLKQVCSTVISEGGYELRGLQQAASVPITTAVDLPVAGTYYNVLSIRLKTSPNRLDAIVILTALSILGITNNAHYNWQVRASGTSSGTTWVDAGADSAVEYKIGGGAYTGGRILASGYTSGSNQGSSSVDILKEALFKFQLERNGLTDAPFELSLVAASNNGGADLYGSMDWEEISR
jgi:hypothetical protein